MSLTSTVESGVVFVGGDVARAGGKRRQTAGAVEGVVVLVGFRWEETAPVDEPTRCVEGRWGTEGGGDILCGGWLLQEAAAAVEEPA